jgi:hypothetical protein
MQDDSFFNFRLEDWAKKNNQWAERTTRSEPSQILATKGHERFIGSVTVVCKGVPGASGNKARSDFNITRMIRHPACLRSFQSNISTYTPPKNEILPTSPAFLCHAMWQLREWCVTSQNLVWYGRFKSRQSMWWCDRREGRKYAVCRNKFLASVQVSRFCKCMADVVSSHALIMVQYHAVYTGRCHTGCPRMRSPILDIFVQKINRVRRVHSSPHEISFSESIPPPHFSPYFTAPRSESHLLFRQCPYCNILCFERKVHFPLCWVMQHAMKAYGFKEIQLHTHTRAHVF